VITPLLEGRTDVTVLPVEAFYPVPFDGRGGPTSGTFAVHHWHASWM
jgi:hypothetical protein